jgi:hypothetical protein
VEPCLFRRTEAESDDERLIARLTALFRELDPVPPPVLAGAGAAFAMAGPVKGKGPAIRRFSSSA